VTGELGRRHPAGVPLGLQGPADPQVQAGPGLAVEPFQDRLAEQVVGEAPGAQRVGRAGQDLGPGGLLEQLAHGPGGRARDPGEEGGGELRPGHGGRGDHLGTRRAEPGQAAPDGLADAEGDPDRRVPPRPGGAAVPGEQQPRHLLDEERVAAGAPPQGGDQRRLRLAAEHAGDQQGDLGLGQRRQGDDGGPGGQVGQQGRQRVVGRGVELAPGGEHEHPGGREPAGQEVEQLQRRRVGPLEVLQDHHQRPVVGGRQDDRGELVQELEAGRGRLGVGGRRGGRPRQLGQEPGQCGGVGGQPAQPRVLGDQGPEHLDPGPVGRRPLALPAPAPDHAGAGTLGVGGRLGGHRRLADAGLAGQQHQPTPAPGRVLHRPAELGEHVRASDQAGPGRLARPRAGAFRRLPDGHARAILPPAAVRGQVPGARLPGVAAALASSARAG